jgi:hypothetical protein
LPPSRHPTIKQAQPVADRQTEEELMRAGTERLERRHDVAVALVVVMAALAMVAGAAAARGDDEFTTEFQPQDCTWSHKGTQNPFFPLVPGWQLVLAGEEEGDEGVEEIEVVVTVLKERQRIVFTTPDGARVSVLARVVEERESVDGELVEVSRNFFAICRETGDVFYFGETVDDYEDGEIVGHGGGWRAGKAGAQPGIMMPGRFLLGARYFQEQAPGVALDRGENIAMSLTAETEAGTFHGCAMVLDTNALHPEDEGDEKVYCRGVGLVRDADAELVDYGFAGGD